MGVAPWHDWQLFLSAVETAQGSSPAVGAAAAPPAAAAGVGLAVTGAAAWLPPIAAGAAVTGLGALLPAAAGRMGAEPAAPWLGEPLVAGSEPHASTETSAAPNPMRSSVCVRRIIVRTSSLSTRITQSPLAPSAQSARNETSRSVHWSTEPELAVCRVTSRTSALEAVISLASVVSAWTHCSTLHARITLRSPFRVATP